MKIPVPSSLGLWSPKEIKRIADEWRRRGFTNIGLSQTENIDDWEKRHLAAWEEKDDNDSKPGMVDNTKGTNE